MRPAILVVAALLLSSAHAEIEKVAAPGEQGIRLAWWPKVSIPKGWEHDRQQSISYGFNALAPEKSTFRDAESVMYAKAIYKPREPAVKSLDDLVGNDKKTFLAQNPSLAVHEIEPVKTADGKTLRVFAFEPKGNGNWERVAYGEEGEFYIVFVVSSRTKAGSERAVADFEKLLRDYREKP